MSEETTPSSTYERLQVPDEPGVYFCARHSNVKTRLRCGRCETPLCPKCMSYGPTGVRCRDCGSNRSSPIYQVSPLQLLIAFGVAFGCSILGALLAKFTFLFVLFYAPVAGTLIGKAITRTIGGKRGVPLAVAATLGIAAGALFPLNALLWSGSPVMQITNPFLWIYIFFAASGVWYWLR